MRPEKRWAKTDPGLRSHPAFIDLVAELDSTPILVDGMLHGLWSVAFFDAPDGDLSRFKPRALARAVGWPVPGKSPGHEGTSPDVLVQSLLDTGFLVKDGDRLLIHDWEDWGGALFAERRYETEKKANQRKPVDNEPDVPGKSPGLPPVSPGPSRVDLDLDREEDKERAEEQGQELVCESVVSAFDADFWPCWPHHKGAKQLARKRFDALTSPQQSRCIGAVAHIVAALDAGLLDPQYLPRAENFIGGTKCYYREWADGIPEHLEARGNGRRSSRALDSSLGALREVARQLDSEVIT